MPHPNEALVRLAQHYCQVQDSAGWASTGGGKVLVTCGLPIGLSPVDPHFWFCPRHGTLAEEFVSTDPIGHEDDDD